MFSETSVNSYQTRLHITRDSNRHFAVCSAEACVGTAVFCCQLYGKKILESLKLNVDVKKCAKSDVSGACEYGNELSGCIKCGEFLD